MSLLDTFTDEVLEEDLPVGAIEARPDGPSVLDTFTDDVAEPERAADVVVEDALVAAAPRGALKRPAAAKSRGRPKATTTAMRDLLAAGSADEQAGPVQKKTKAEAGRLGAAARWCRKEAPVVDDGPAVPEALALVPWVEGKGAVPDHPMVDKSLTAVVTASAEKIAAQPSKIDISKEAKLINSCRTIQSKVSLAKSTGIHHKTVTRKLILLSTLCVLMKRKRGEDNIDAVWNLLKEKAVHTCKGILRCCKDKSDEVQLRCAVRDSLDAHKRQAAADGSAQITPPNSVVAKILQITRTIGCLWQVDDAFIMLVQPRPTTIRNIAATSAESIRDGWERQGLTDEAERNRWQYLMRMSITDSHRGILRADWSMLLDRPWEWLLKVLCDLHVQQKIAEVVFAGYYQDAKGLLHSTLALQFAGCWVDFKRIWEEYVEDHVVIIPNDGHYPGPEADAHRELVFDKYCRGATLDDAGRLPSALVSSTHAKRSICNGNYRLRGRIEHIEKGCCKDRKDTINKYKVNIIHREVRPPQWAYDKWKGIEPSFDFHGWGFECNNQFEPVFRKLFQGTSWPKPTFGPQAFFAIVPSDADAVEQDNGDGANDADDNLLAALVPAAAGLDAQLPGLEDPEKGAAAAERQKCYRKNVIVWLDSEPRPRMWTMREIMRDQQKALDLSLKDVGPKFHERNQQRRRENPTAEVRSRVMKAVLGDYTRPSAKAYSSLVRNFWRNMPKEYITHELEIMTYISCASCRATSYQLREVRWRMWPFLPFLSQDPDQYDAITTKMEYTVNHEPCVMDPFFWDLMSKDFKTLAAIRSKVFAAILRFLEYLLELENGSTEANNAALRRQCKRAIQSKLLSMDDLSLFWTFKSVAQAHFDIWGFGDLPGDDVLPTEDATAPANVAPTPGGGLQRAYFHKYKDTAKDETGQVQFGELNRRFNEEQRKPFSQILEDLKPMGQAATKAHQAKQALEQAGHTVRHSSFGVTKPRDIERAKTRMMVKSLSDAMAPPTAAAASSTALVPYAAGSTALAIVQSHVGPDLGQQTQLVRRVAHHRAMEANAKERESRVALREVLHGPAGVGSIDLSSVRLSPGSQLFADPFADLPVFHFYDPCVAEAATVVASPSFNKKFGGISRDALCKAWSVEHLYREPTSLPDIGTMPSDYAPTACFRDGGGVCLCQGQGLLWGLGRKRLAALLANNCPPKTLARRQLQGGRFVLQLQGRYFFHIALMYLNPRRPTFIQCSFRTSCSWGGYAIFPEYDHGSILVARTDVEAMQLLNLRTEASCRIWELTGSSRRFEAFRPAERLTVKLASEPKSNDFVFYEGPGQELNRAVEERRAKAKRAAAKPRPAKTKPAPSPRPQRVRRNQVAPKAGQLGAELEHLRRPPAPRLAIEDVPADGSGMAVDSTPTDYSEIDRAARELFEPESTDEDKEPDSGFHEVVAPDGGVSADMFWANAFSDEQLGGSGDEVVQPLHPANDEVDVEELFADGSH